MKKVIIIICTLFILCGCSNKEEKESKFYKSIKNLFIVDYINDGVGLAVYIDETINVDGAKYYKVADTSYNLSNINLLVESTFASELSNTIKSEISNDYIEVSNNLYTKSNGGCLFDYQLFDENLEEELKEGIKIVKIKNKKIIFKYKEKEYEAIEYNDTYKFSNKVFECVS